MRKDKFKILKFILAGLIILIPIVKILIGAQFGITLMSDVRVIYSYILSYAILAVILIAMVKNFSFGIAIILYLCIYGGNVILTSGITFRHFDEYKSPNNEHILLVNVVTDWGQSTDVHFYEKLNPYLKKSIRTPTLEGHNPAVFDVFWDENDNPIISGDLIIQNKTKLKKIKDILPEKCDYELVDKKLYLKLD